MSTNMLEILIIIAFFVGMVVQQKRHMRRVDVLLSKKQRVIESQPDPLTVALGKIPEGNYQAFISDPEAFARAHAAGERISRIEEHKADEVKQCLDAARTARNSERRNAINYGVNDNDAVRHRAVAEAMEQRAQKLIDDEDVFRRSAQLRAIGE